MVVPLTILVWRFNTRLKNIKKRTDKSNRKLKIYINAIPVPNGSICCTYHQLNTHLLTAQKTSKQEQHKRAYLSKNGGLGKKKLEEWAISRKEGKDRKSNRTRQKNKRGDIEKCDQTGSPELPDSRKTSENSGLPSGEIEMKKPT